MSRTTFVRGLRLAEAGRKSVGRAPACSTLDAPGLQQRNSFSITHYTLTHFMSLTRGQRWFCANLVQ